MMDGIKRCLPDIYEQSYRLGDYVRKPNYEEAPRTAYQAITPISIDYGVMEKTTADVFVIPGHHPWSDVGSWQAVYEVMNRERDNEGNLVDGDVLLLDCKNIFVHTRCDRLIGCVGAEDLCIIDTPDGLLVCGLRSSQDVRRFVQRLEDKRLDYLL